MRQPHPTATGLHPSDTESQTLLWPVLPETLCLCQKEDARDQGRMLAEAPGPQDPVVRSLSMTAAVPAVPGHSATTRPPPHSLSAALCPIWSSALEETRSLRGGTLW